MGKQMKWYRRPEGRTVPGPLRWVGLLLLASACFPDKVTLCEHASYPDGSTSPYVLPFPVGKSYIVAQGNCANADDHWHWNTHREDSYWAFAYDFEMPVGSIVIASREGEVVLVQEQFTDEDKELEQSNSVVIKHRDGTYATYGHFTHYGVWVNAGDRVVQGDTLGLSGNSGLSFIPHLHIQVSPCRDASRCGTMPLTFLNTRAHPNGLEKGGVYEARPYNNQQ